MGHLPDHIRLRTWRSGDQFPSAAELNAEFGTVFAAAELAMAQAREPDQGAQEALERVGQVELRLALLETHEAATERERGLRQYTPLAAHAILARQISQLAGPLQERAAGLHARCADMDTLTARLETLESAPPPPPAASPDEVMLLRKEMQRARAEANLALGQLAGLRSEIAAMRQLVTDPDRGANRKQYAPLAAFAMLLRRIEALEAKAP